MGVLALLERASGNRLQMRIGQRKLRDRSQDRDPVDLGAWGHVMLLCPIVCRPTEEEAARRVAAYAARHERIEAAYLAELKRLGLSTRDHGDSCKESIFEPRLTDAEIEAVAGVQTKGGA